MTTSCELQHVQIPGYQLVAPLGEGTHGQVWKANGPGNTSVAIKFVDLHRNCGHREWNAVQVIKRIRHANLMPVTAVWMIDEDGSIAHDESQQRRAVESIEDGVCVSGTLGINDRPRWMAIAMPLGGETLDQRLGQCQPGSRMSPGELCGYLLDAAKALDYLNRPVHDRTGKREAIQHCDVKPANIILMGNSAQLCDFGVARILHDVQPSAGLGSPAYMAPECIRDQRPSRTSDQYSLAITYVELRTGSLPFDEESLEAVNNAHLSGRLNLSRLPEEEQKVIRKATSLDPDRRYDSATEMVQAIQRALTFADKTSRAVQTRRHRNRPTRLSRVFNRLLASAAGQPRAPGSRERAARCTLSPASMAAETRAGAADGLDETKGQADSARRVPQPQPRQRMSKQAQANEAIKWFRRAAAQGNAAAQKNLGDCYFRGWGVTQDDHAAAHWYRKAALQGHASAQNRLGFCYCQGRGVSKHFDNAMRCFRAAAEKNHAAAQNNLALCLRHPSVSSG